MEESFQEKFYKRCVERLKIWRDIGVDPFGQKYDNITSIKKVKELINSEDDKAKIKYSGDQIDARIAGRIVAIRNMGKAIFFDIKDRTDKIQIYANIDSKIISCNNLDFFKYIELLDIGDIIGVEGVTFITKTKELTLKVKEITLLSKTMRAFPEKFHGFTNQESRYRQRYLDFIINEHSINIIKKRSLAINEIRKYFHNLDYFEVEIPVLQFVSGGAIAKPFKTFYNALGTEMKLKIAPELFLKKLLVGGFERVFEISKVFRNEGISKNHSPEFTMLEFYQAYADCRVMMGITERLISNIANKINNTYDIKINDKYVINLKPPFKRIDYATLIKEKVGDDWYNITNQERIERIIKYGYDINISKLNENEFEITYEIYSKLIEPFIIQPTFVTRIPAALVPLAKKCKDNPSFVDVAELIINGTELSAIYSELNDPIEQKKRFIDQDPEQSDIDQEFLDSMCHGQPPAGGVGIGIDRLIMLILCVDSIRDVIPFPLVRPLPNKKENI